MPARSQKRARALDDGNNGAEPWRLAHDLNNILNIIDGYAKLLHEQLPAEGRERKMVAEIQLAVERGVALAERLRISGPARDAQSE